jgi:hypothetical protein
MSVSALSHKNHAIALRDRCARQFGSGGGIAVGDVSKRYSRGSDYTFDIDGYSKFEFRGRERHKIIWTARVHVTPQHNVVIEELEGSTEPVPAEALACALDALRAEDYHVRSR